MVFRFTVIPAASCVRKSRFSWHLPGKFPEKSLGKIWFCSRFTHTLRAPHEILSLSFFHPASYVSSILHYDSRRDIISETCCLIRRMLFFLTFSSCHNCVAKDAKNLIIYHVQSSTISIKILNFWFFLEKIVIAMRYTYTIFQPH